MRPITFITAYYRNPQQLREQMTVWRSYKQQWRGLLHAIVTDDCSPERYAALPVVQAEAVPGIASFRLNRTLKDVRWNWLFCRNLGVSQAETEWVLLTDIDHVLHEDTLRTLTTMDLNPQAVYRFSRVDAPRPWPYKLSHCKPYKPHPNSWFMTRQMFDRIGGYDERFSGLYGSDGEFRDRVNATAAAVIMLPNPLIRYPRTIIPDASTHESWRDGENRPIARKTEYDGAGIPRAREARAKIPNWTPLRLTFPWEHQITLVAGRDLQEAV